MSLYQVTPSLIPFLVYPFLSFTDILAFSVTSGYLWEVLVAHRKTLPGRTMIIDRIRKFFDGFKQLDSAKLFKIMEENKAVYTGGSLFGLLEKGQIPLNTIRNVDLYVSTYKKRKLQSHLEDSGLVMTGSQFVDAFFNNISSYSAPRSDPLIMELRVVAYFYNTHNRNSFNGKRLRLGSIWETIECKEKKMSNESASVE